MPNGRSFRFTALKAWFITGRVILPVNECTFRFLFMVCLSRIATTEFGPLIHLRLFLSDFRVALQEPGRAISGFSRRANCPRVISTVLPPPEVHALHKPPVFNDLREITPAEGRFAGCGIGRHERWRLLKPLISVEFRLEITSDGRPQVVSWQE